jgi:hypothetical protein
MRDAGHGAEGACSALLGLRARQDLARELHLAADAFEVGRDGRILSGQEHLQAIRSSLNDRERLAKIVSEFVQTGHVRSGFDYSVSVPRLHVIYAENRMLLESHER